MRPTFMLFSGLPGTGKTALTDRLAREIHWPLLRIDDVAAWAVHARRRILPWILLLPLASIMFILAIIVLSQFG